MDSVFVLTNALIAEQQGKLDFVVGSLYPIVAQQTGRYNVAKRVQRSHIVIEAGKFLTSRNPAPQYLPQQWSAYTHPEGKIYFGRNTPLRVITDSYLYDPRTADKVIYWTQTILKQAEDRSFDLSDTVELYLQIEDDDCCYYFADHATRTLFWLDDYETSELGLLPVVSPSHLKLVLEEQYWNHLENFSMHSSKLKSNVVDELISILTHAYADHMTSCSSTFPYDVKECKSFLKLLKGSRDCTDDGYILTVAARLFGTISQNRYFTHYGQEQARLSRDTPILVETAEEIAWSANVISAVTLRSSDQYHTRLNEIFTDNYVYVMDWTSFMTSCMKKWKNAFHASLCLLILHVFCCFFPVSQTLAAISGGLLSLSLISSALLIHRHEDLENGSAGVAYEYLSNARLNKFKFQGLALAYSLPQTFHLWGLLVFFSQWVLFISTVYLGLIAGALAISGLVLVFLNRAGSRSSLPFLSRFYTRILSSNKEKDIGVISPV